MYLVSNAIDVLQSQPEVAVLGLAESDLVAVPVSVEAHVQVLTTEDHSPAQPVVSTHLTRYPDAAPRRRHPVALVGRDLSVILCQNDIILTSCASI